jgi:hypothetical protein
MRATLGFDPGDANRLSEIRLTCSEGISGLSKESVEHHWASADRQNSFSQAFQPQRGLPTQTRVIALAKADACRADTAT